MRLLLGFQFRFVVHLHNTVEFYLVTTYAACAGPFGTCSRHACRTHYILHKHRLHAWPNPIVCTDVLVSPTTLTTAAYFKEERIKSQACVRLGGNLGARLVRLVDANISAPNYCQTRTIVLTAQGARAEPEKCFHALHATRGGGHRHAGCTSDCGLCNTVRDPTAGRCPARHHLPQFQWWCYFTFTLIASSHRSQRLMGSQSRPICITTLANPASCPIHPQLDRGDQVSVAVLQ